LVFALAALAAGCRDVFVDLTPTDADVAICDGDDGCDADADGE
jgi:hypothetical protein